MTKKVAVFDHTNHKKMWNWLAKTGKDKDEWPGWEMNGGNIPAYEVKNMCFACDFHLEDAQVEPLNQGCTNCPFEKGSVTLSKGEHGCLRGLFMQWAYANTTKEGKKLARKIANLPLREDWEWYDICE
jgi:hypothetical protein